MTQKIIVLDSNIPLLDPQAILKFQEHIIIIPQILIEEVDSKKKEQREIGYCSRQFSRLMDELCLKGKLTEGVDIGDQGGKLFVQIFNNDVANCLPQQDLTLADNKIIATAIYIQEKHPDKEVVLISNDTNVRVNCNIFGIKSEDYKNAKVQSDSLYTGIQHLNISQEEIDLIYKEGKLDVQSLQIKEPYPNECFVLHSTSNTKHSALCRYNSIMKEVILLPQDMKTCDILPKNVEQTFALDILKDESIHLVSLEGKAGTGKTLITLTAALYGVLETQKYSKILLLKPIVPMDNSHELGFLPGGLDEKLGPWMASYSDNITQIMSVYMKEDEFGKKKKSKKENDVAKEKEMGKLNPVQELIAHGFLEFGSLEHARGRNWSNTFVIIDEGQNTSKATMKTILTRIGEGSKIVVMGDPSQIDSPYLDSKSNGLTIIQDLFKSQEIAGHITLTKSERSKLAEIASDLL